MSSKLVVEQRFGLFFLPSIKQTFQLSIVIVTDSCFSSIQWRWCIHLHSCLWKDAFGCTEHDYAVFQRWCTPQLTPITSGINNAPLMRPSGLWHVEWFWNEEADLDGWPLGKHHSTIVICSFVKVISPSLLPLVMCRSCQVMKYVNPWPHVTALPAVIWQDR